MKTFITVSFGNGCSEFQLVTPDALSTCMFTIKKVHIVGVQARRGGSGSKCQV